MRPAARSTKRERDRLHHTEAIEPGKRDCRDAKQKRERSGGRRGEGSPVVIAARRTKRCNRQREKGQAGSDQPERRVLWAEHVERQRSEREKASEHNHGERASPLRRAARRGLVQNRAVRQASGGNAGSM